MLLAADKGFASWYLLLPQIFTAIASETLHIQWQGA